MKIPYELSKNCIVDVVEQEFIVQQQQNLLSKFSARQAVDAFLFTLSNMLWYNYKISYHNYKINVFDGYKHKISLTKSDIRTQHRAVITFTQVTYMCSCKAIITTSLITRKKAFDISMNTFFKKFGRSWYLF